MKLLKALFVVGVVIVSLLEDITCNEVDPPPPEDTRSIINTLALEDEVRQPRILPEDNKIATDGYDPFPGQVPYYAEVNVKSKYLTAFHRRAGALVTLNYVLMPAYFLYQMLSEMEYGMVGLGALGNGSVVYEQHINFSVYGINFHPLYKHPTQELYNIALIRLERPAIMSRYVKPIRLPRLSDRRTYEMMEGTIPGAFSNPLRYARNQVMTNAECMPGIASTVSDQLICANSYVGGSFCALQHGSPLAIEDENGPVLVGLGYYVYACSYTTPNRFLRVSFFREWLRLNTDYIFEMKVSSALFVLCVIVSCFVGKVISSEVNISPESTVHHALPVRVPDVKRQLKNPRNDNKLATEGFKTFPGQYPYRAWLESTHSSTRYGTVVTGALITPNYILTTRIRNIDLDKTLHGVAILAAGYGSWEQRINFTATATSFHPIHDIGSIRLDHSATLNNYVLPVRLPRLSDTRSYENMEGTSVGGYYFARYLRNRVMSNEACSQAHPSFYASDAYICTDRFKGGSFCQIQHGSPLTIEDENGVVLIGVTNVIKICELNDPTVYVRVSLFRDWIQNNSDYVFEY
uniref:Peptidase S1 domain-containing protein n=1 Tax=Anopheles christyi TaxID=43041 RepID=A0A182KGB4_9DIPT